MECLPSAKQVLESAYRHIQPVAHLLMPYLPVQDLAFMVDAYYSCRQEFENDIYFYGGSSSMAAVLSQSTLPRVRSWLQSVMDFLTRNGLFRTQLCTVLYLTEYKRCHRVWCYYARPVACSCDNPILSKRL